MNTVSELGLDSEVHSLTQLIPSLSHEFHHTVVVSRRSSVCKALHQARVIMLEEIDKLMPCFGSPKSRLLPSSNCPSTLRFTVSKKSYNPKHLTPDRNSKVYVQSHCSLEGTLLLGPGRISVLLVFFLLPLISTPILSPTNHTTFNMDPLICSWPCKLCFMYTYVPVCLIAMEGFVFKILSWFLLFSIRIFIKSVHYMSNEVI